jgi:ATP-dependent DNA ligase
MKKKKYELLAKNIDNKDLKIIIKKFIYTSKFNKFNNYDFSHNLNFNIIILCQNIKNNKLFNEFIILYNWLCILHFNIWSKKKKILFSSLIAKIFNNKKKAEQIKANFLFEFNKFNKKNMEKIFEKINKTKQFPKLYKIDKNNNVRLWHINKIIEHDDGTVSWYIIHGIKGGKMQEDVKNVIKGTKGNTIVKTAFLDAKSLFKKKLKLKYGIDIQKAKKLLNKVSPMLAYDWKSIKKKPETIWVGQPKLDGTRALSRIENNNVKMYKRGGDKITTLKKIKKELSNLKFEDKILWIDGEIYKHGIQQTDINKIINSFAIIDDEKKKLENLLEYHIYDMFVENKKMQYRDRYTFISDNIKKFKRLKLVKIFKVDIKKLDKITNKLLENGYEGLIIRDIRGYYEFGRSKSLFKYKIEQDDTAKILNIRSNNKKRRFGILIDVINKKGIKFSLTGTGKIDYRKKVLEEKDKYIGKKIKYGYYGLTTDLIPKHSNPHLNKNNEYIIL